MENGLNIMNFCFQSIKSISSYDRNQYGFETAIGQYARFFFVCTYLLSVSSDTGRKRCVKYMRYIHRHEAVNRQRFTRVLHKYVISINQTEVRWWISFYASNLMNKCFNTLYAVFSQLFIEMLIEFAPSAICPVVL